MSAAEGYDRIADMVGGLEGWMTPAQGRRLFAAAQRCPTNGRIVEIGSFRGKSTVVLATAAGPGTEVVAVDPHAGNDRGPREIEGYVAEAATDHEIFWANLRAAGVADRVRQVREFSDRAHPSVEGSIDLLYVDGAHRFGPARRDVRDWGRRVIPGGTMLVHDSFSSIGVTAAILRELASGRRFTYVGRSGSLAEFVASSPHGRGERWRHRTRLFGQLPWFARNVALKVALTLGLGTWFERRGRTAPEWPY